MQSNRYSEKDFDVERLAADLKLSIDECDRESFLADICDMANCVYDNLMSESADGTLAISAPRALWLSELREDEPQVYEAIEDILSLAPSVREGHIAVPKTVGDLEVSE